MEPFTTHIVTNQPAPLQDYCLYDTDPALREAVLREGAGTDEAALREHGQWLGRAETLAAGEAANRHSPELHAYDQYGHRIDRVRFHPAWHALMEGIASRGLHSGAWADPAPGAQAARAARYLMQGQVEAGTLCPTTMTFGAVPILRAEPPGALDLARDWLPRLLAPRYDPADRPAPDKAGLLIGMGLTEKQGGSDVRSNTTEARPAARGGRGQAYLLVGHKWFLSVPQADAHLVLARAPEGLSCFLVPRYVPDGARNAVRIRRLKDKLGNRSNASAEVEFENAWGMLVGEPGHGVATLIAMATHTRLDCALGSAALMRQALVQAAHHAAGRSAFGRRLAEQPLMRSVLIDLALESEAATALTMRLARAFDQRADAGAAALLRIGTPAVKLWVCRRAVAMVAECLEVLGGNGYVEECVMPRLYRETPVNSIWEGSGNVMALDVLRALQREPGVLDALMPELDAARGQYAAYDAALAAWRGLLAERDAERAQALGRTVAGGLARLWQAALLIRHAPAFVADAFVAARCAAPGAMAGDLPPQAMDPRILARAWPPIC